MVVMVRAGNGPIGAPPFPAGAISPGRILPKGLMRRRLFLAAAAAAASAEVGPRASAAPVFTSSGVAAAARPPARFAHDVVVDFDTPVAAGSWPGDGTAPAAYPRILTYPDGTSGKYFPSKVLSVHDGVLDYFDRDGMAAAVLPFGYAGFRYGTYSVTMRCQHYAGFHNAFLMWPNRGRWPVAGEYDFPESDTAAPAPYLAVVQDTHPVTFLPRRLTHCPRSWHDRRFHTYTQQWGPGFLRCYQDGIVVGTVTANIQTEAMHPVLQNEWAPRTTKPGPADTGTPTSAASPTTPATPWSPPTSAERPRLDVRPTAGRDGENGADWRAVGRTERPGDLSTRCRPSGRPAWVRRCGRGQWSTGWFSPPW